MPDLSVALDILAHHPQQWAGMSLLVMFAVGVVRWTPPPRTANCGDCKGDGETCRCGNGRVPLPRRITGGTR